MASDLPHVLPSFFTAVQDVAPVTLLCPHVGQLTLSIGFVGMVGAISAVCLEVKCVGRNIWEDRVLLRRQINNENCRSVDRTEERQSRNLALYIVEGI